MPSRETFASGVPVTKQWSSAKDTLMSVAEIEAYLDEHRIFEPYLSPGNGA
jgi:hypothetical protein